MSAKSWPSMPGAPLLERHCACSNFDIGGTSAVLGLAAMGAAYRRTARGVKSTFTSSFSHTIDLSELANLQHLMVRLVDPAFTGTFDTLQFLLTDNGATIEDKSFTEVSSAIAFFADQTLDLGA